MNRDAPSQNANFILYSTGDDTPRVDVFVQDETIWLTQKRKAELSSMDVRTIGEHLRNIFNAPHCVCMERSLAIFGFPRRLMPISCGPAKYFLDECASALLIFGAFVSLGPSVQTAPKV